VTFSGEEDDIIYQFNTWKSLIEKKAFDPGSVHSSDLHHRVLISFADFLREIGAIHSKSAEVTEQLLLLFHHLLNVSFLTKLAMVITSQSYCI